MARQGFRRATDYRCHQGAHRPPRGSRGREGGKAQARREGAQQRGTKLHHQGEPPVIIIVIIIVVIIIITIIIITIIAGSLEAQLYIFATDVALA